MNDDPDLVQVASRLAGILGKDRCVLIGGIAVGVHGYVRATDDVDVIVIFSLAEARRRLEAEGIAVQMKRGNVLDGDFPCLKGMLDGIPFDVLPCLVPLDWERAIEVPTESGALPVVDLEGLLRLKLRAQGPQDVLDVAVLVLLRPEYREKAREIAAANRALDKLDSFLANRRTQATAAEQAAREEGPSRTKAPKRPRRDGRRRR